LPLGRALPVTPKQRLIREMILQLKTGRLDAAYFQEKFGTDIRTEFADGFGKLEAAGILTPAEEGFALTDGGYLQVDRHLPAFFEPEYRNTRYT